MLLWKAHGCGQGAEQRHVQHTYLATLYLPIPYYGYIDRKGHFVYPTYPPTWLQFTFSLQLATCMSVESQNMVDSHVVITILVALFR